MAFDLEEMSTRAVATNNTKLLQEIRSLVREEPLRCNQENPTDSSLPKKQESFGA